MLCTFTSCFTRVTVWQHWLHFTVIVHERGYYGERYKASAKVKFLLQFIEIKNKSSMIVFSTSISWKCTVQFVQYLYTRNAPDSPHTLWDIDGCQIYVSQFVMKGKSQSLHYNCIINAATHLITCIFVCFYIWYARAKHSICWIMAYENWGILVLWKRAEQHALYRTDSYQQY